MGFVIAIIGLLALCAAFRVGIGISLIFVVIVTSILIAYHQIRKNAEEKDASESLKKLAKKLPKIVTTVTVLLFIAGLIMIIVGLTTFTGEDGYKFTGDICTACGGDGWLVEKECLYCYGSGYKFDHVYAQPEDILWIGVLVSISSAFIFAVVKYIMDD